MTLNTERQRIAIGRSGVAGWLLLQLEYGIYVYVLPHGAHFASDAGKFAAWVVFSTIFTLWYLPAFALLTLIAMLLRRSESICRASSWLLPLMGGIASGLFSLLVSSSRIRASHRDTVFISVLFAIAGAISMAVLSSNLKVTVEKSPSHK